jgi:hypothetical protein
MVDQPLRTMEPHMKFVLVNGRSPRTESFCALCCEPIGEGYVRELTTHLCYCNYECHLAHSKIAFSVLTERARASLTERAEAVASSL